MKATPFVYFSTWPNKTLISKAYKDTIQEYHRKGTNFDSLKEKLALIVAYWTSYLHPNRFKYPGGAAILPKLIYTTKEIEFISG